MSPLFFRDYIQLQKKEKGYYFSPDEREIDFDEALNTSAFIQEYFQYFCGNESNIRALFQTYTADTNNFIGIPFQNVYNPKKIKYYDPRILYRVTASNGLAAGNTIKEALVQGISELFERWGIYRFYKEPQNTYYTINLNDLHDDNISKIYNNIKELGCDIVVYDLSYNFQIPVILSVLNYKKKCRIYTNFASAPVINIAIERTLTEMYQGIQTYNYISDTQSPFRLTTGDAAIMEDGNNITNSCSFPENALLNIVEVNYNTNMFLNNETHDNNYMLNVYYKNICDKLNIELYYRDNSLIKDIAAIVVFIDQTDTFNVKPFPLEQTSNLMKKEWINRIHQYYKISEFIFESNKNHTLTMESFLNYLFSINWDIRPLSDIVNFYHGILMFDEWKAYLHPVHSNIGILDHYAFIRKRMDSFNMAAFTGTEQVILNRFITLRGYIESGLYSIDEIKKLYNLWGYDLTDTDIENYNNIDYIFWKTCIEPEKKIYESGDYDILLHSFIKED